MTILGKFLAALLAFASVTKAQDFSALKLTQERMNLLAGRLTISGPAYARSIPRPHDIMAAPASPQEETRIMFDVGQKKVVVMATELFAYTGPDFFAAAKREVGYMPMKFDLRQRTIPSKLQIVEYLPEAPTTDQSANMIMGTLVAMADGSVENLVWYANPPAAVDVQGALAVARSMEDTIDSGDRKFDLSKGERRLCGYSKTRSVFVTLPQGYVTTEQRGIDFTVQFIRKLALLGDGSRMTGIHPSLGLYLGDNPSRSRGESKLNGTASIFGKRIEWSQKTFEDQGQTTISVGALMKLGQDSEDGTSGHRDGPAYADIFLTAGDMTTIEELKSIAATLKLTEGVSAP